MLCSDEVKRRALARSKHNLLLSSMILSSLAALTRLPSPHSGLIQWRTLPSSSACSNRASSGIADSHAPPSGVWVGRVSLCMLVNGQIVPHLFAARPSVVARDLVRDLNGIPLLVSAISAPLSDDELKRLAAGCIWSICKQSPSNCDIVLDCGGVDSICHLLEHGNDEQKCEVKALRSSRCLSSHSDSHHAGHWSLAQPRRPQHRNWRAHRAAQRAQNAQRVRAPGQKLQDSGVVGAGHQGDHVAMKTCFSFAAHLRTYKPTIGTSYACAVTRAKCEIKQVPRFRLLQLRRC